MKAAFIMFDNVSPDELTLLTSLIAISISKGLNTDDLSLIATVLSTIAGNLFLIVAKRGGADDVQSYIGSSSTGRSNVLKLPEAGA
jgi:hypothetical protein